MASEAEAIYRAAAGEQAPLRIAFYSPALPESGVSNGIVTYVGIMRDGLRSLGHQVMILTLDQVEDVNGEVKDLPRRSPFLAGIDETLERIRPSDGSHPSLRSRLINAFTFAKAAGAEVFEIEESFGWAARLTGRGVPIVERLHGPEGLIREALAGKAQPAPSSAREAAEMRSLTLVDAVSAPSTRLLKTIAERYSLELPLSRAIPNPVPVFDGVLERRMSEADLSRILWVGRFDRCKGADVVLRAFAAAHQRMNRLSLVMVGPDNGLLNADGSVVRFAEFVAAEIPEAVRARIEFLGEQPPSTIAALREQCGMAIMASRFDNFGYALTEAMAAGMAVLSTSTYGALELLRNGVDGRVVRVGDISGMADAIVEMAAEPDRLLEMGRSSFRRVKTTLDPRKIAVETAEFYRTAVCCHNRRR